MRVRVVAILLLALLTTSMVAPATASLTPRCWLQYKCPFFQGFGALCTYAKFDNVPSKDECMSVLTTVEARQTMRKAKKRNWVLTWSPGDGDPMCTIDNPKYLLESCLRKAKEPEHIKFDLMPLNGGPHAVPEPALQGHAED